MGESQSLVEARKILNQIIDSPVSIDRHKAFLKEIETKATFRKLTGEEINRLVEEVRKNSKTKASSFYNLLNKLDTLAEQMLKK